MEKLPWDAAVAVEAYWLWEADGRKDGEQSIATLEGPMLRRERHWQLGENIVSICANLQGCLKPGMLALIRNLALRQLWAGEVIAGEAIAGAFTRATLADGLRVIREQVPRVAGGWAHHAEGWGDLNRLIKSEQ